VFYFQPGHETFPIYHQKEVQQVITNAVRWAAPVKMVGFRDLQQAPHTPDLMEEFTIKD
jgi:trehalose utilization protein